VERRKYTEGAVGRRGKGKMPRGEDMKVPTKVQREEKNLRERPKQKRRGLIIRGCLGVKGEGPHSTLNQTKNRR